MCGSLNQTHAREDDDFRIKVKLFEFVAVFVNSLDSIVLFNFNIDLEEISWLKDRVFDFSLICTIAVHSLITILDGDGVIRISNIGWLNVNTS